MSCLALSRTAQIGLSQLLRMLMVLNGTACEGGLTHAASAARGVGLARDTIAAIIKIKTDRFVMRDTLLIILLVMGNLLRKTFPESLRAARSPETRLP